MSKQVKCEPSVSSLWKILEQFNEASFVKFMCENDMEIFIKSKGWHQSRLNPNNWDLVDNYVDLDGDYNKSLVEAFQIELDRIQ